MRLEIISGLNWVAAAGDFIGQRLKNGGLFVASGGNSPAQVFRHLVKQELPWGQITVTLSDERWVPPDHPDSNEGVLRRELGQTGINICSLYNGAASPLVGLGECEARLSHLPWPAEVSFLGMGEDGHTASLFPGEGHEGGYCVTGKNNSRLSLSRSRLLRSRAIILLVNSPAKLQVFKAALGGADLPVTKIIRQSLAPIFAFTIEEKTL